jgi:hypothetical protein
VPGGRRGTAEMLAVRWHARGDVRVEQVPLRLLGRGAVQAAPLITDRSPLEAAVSGGLAPLRDEPDKHLKILVQPGDAG